MENDINVFFKELLKFKNKKEKLTFKKNLLQIQIVNKIHKEMEKNNINKEQLCELTKIPRRKLNKIFSIDKDIDLNTLIKIQDVLCFNIEIKIKGENYGK